jgi:hypothetical protein
MILSQETQTKPKMLIFSIIRARGRLQGGPKAITDTIGEERDTMICGKGDRGGLKIYRVVLQSGLKICKVVQSRLVMNIGV